MVFRKQKQAEVLSFLLSALALYTSTPTKIFRRKNTTVATRSATTLILQLIGDMVSATHVALKDSEVPALFAPNGLQQAP
jgi:hypothetical protein